MEHPNDDILMKILLKILANMSVTIRTSLDYVPNNSTQILSFLISSSLPGPI
uniref:Uncharacterized protein n=1 Tax=Meloidogyne incognita TaxID=6306 RepID=A0A914LK92_MELIC